METKNITINEYEVGDVLEIKISNASSKCIVIHTEDRNDGLRNYNVMLETGLIVYIAAGEMNEVKYVKNISFPLLLHNLDKTDFTDD